MKIENTVINQNDNAEFLRDVYLGEDKYGDKSRRLQWRDTALSLIDKYLPAHRKNRLAEWHIAEKAIVETIDRLCQRDKNSGRSPSVALDMLVLATFIQAPHIKFFNDPALPEFMQGYSVPILY